MFCPKCGKELLTQDQVCPDCGYSQDRIQHGMKWYKFLIYFSLFAGAVFNLIYAIMYFVGAHYQGMAEDVYDLFPGLKVVDILYGLLCIGMGVLALYVRSALVKYKSQAPNLVCIYYAVGAGSSLIYTIMTSAVTGISTFAPSVIVGLIGNILILVLNYIYFNNRKHYFVN